MRIIYGALLIAGIITFYIGILAISFKPKKKGIQCQKD